MVNKQRVTYQLQQLKSDLYDIDNQLKGLRQRRTAVLRQIFQHEGALAVFAEEEQCTETNLQDGMTSGGKDTREPANIT